MGDKYAPEGSIGAGSLEDGVRAVGLAGGAGGRFLSEWWPARTALSCSSTGAVGEGPRRVSEMGRTVEPPHQRDAGGGQRRKKLGSRWGNLIGARRATR